MSTDKLSHLTEQERGNAESAKSDAANPLLTTFQRKYAAHLVSLSEQLSSARGEIAALKEGRDKSVALAAHQFREERERAEAAEQERDRLKDKLESFLRDGSRSLDDVAREIVETLRPLDRPGSSEYNITFVRSKLNSVAESRLRDLREKVGEAAQRLRSIAPTAIGMTESELYEVAALLEGQHG